MRVAIIPARGGSKRIPRKNIRPFCGKPMISYSIEAALASGLFDRVLVSTDDPEIAEVAIGCGAEVPFLRPPSLSDDHTGVGEVVKHAIQWLQERGTPPEHLCLVYATAPFLRSRYLREGFEKLVQTGKSFAFSVTTFPFPIQRAVRLSADGGVEAFHPEHIFSRSQDLDEAYHDAGQFCWGKVRSFLDGEVVFSPVSVPIVIPRFLVQDIDTLEDWRRAELMFLALRQAEEEPAADGKGAAGCPARLPAA